MSVSLHHGSGIKSENLWKGRYLLWRVRLRLLCDSAEAYLTVCALEAQFEQELRSLLGREAYEEGFRVMHFCLQAGIEVWRQL